MESENLGQWESRSALAQAVLLHLDYHHSPSDRSQRPKDRTSQDGQIAHGHYVERKRYTSWVLKVVLLSTPRKMRSYYYGPISVILTLVRISPASWIQGI